MTYKRPDLETWRLIWYVERKIPSLAIGGRVMDDATIHTYQGEKVNDKWSSGRGEIRAVCTCIVHRTYFPLECVSRVKSRWKRQTNFSKLKALRGRGTGRRKIRKVCIVRSSNNKSYRREFWRTLQESKKWKEKKKTSYPFTKSRIDKPRWGGIVVRHH